LSFVLGIALVPLLDHYQSIFAAINDVIAHVAPPITCVFLLGLFWRGASARGAKITMWVGSGLGALVFALKTLQAWQPAVYAWVPGVITHTPFMMMCFYLFSVCVLLQVCLSLALPKQAHEDPQHLYWEHPLDCARSPGWPGLANYRVLSAFIFIAMITLYALFK
jgi:SSS family solute:Na+ symporter